MLLCFTCAAACSISQSSRTRAAVKRLIAVVSPADPPRYHHSPDRTRRATDLSDETQQDARQGHFGTPAAPVPQTAAEVGSVPHRRLTPPPPSARIQVKSCFLTVVAVDVVMETILHYHL